MQIVGNAAPTKAPRKKSAPKAKKEGPCIQNCIMSVVADCKEWKGAALPALAGKGVDVSKANKHINTAVTKLVAQGTLSQTKGTGASGSFKLTNKKPAVTNQLKRWWKKAPAKVKKTTAAKKLAAKKLKAVKKSLKKALVKKAVKKVTKSPKVTPKKTKK